MQNARVVTLCYFVTWGHVCSSDIKGSPQTQTPGSCISIEVWHFAIWCDRHDKFNLWAKSAYNQDLTRLNMYSMVIFIYYTSNFINLLVFLVLISSWGFCVSCVLTRVWKQRSVTWKSPTETFKGCGSQAKSNIWVWSDGEVHRRNLFIRPPDPHPQMRISTAVRIHRRVLGNKSWQVTC